MRRKRTNTLAPRNTSGLHIALLRGINVGGKNKLAMKDLRELAEQAGAEDVRTYIQSGNVVYRASAILADHMPALLSRAIDENLDLRVPVVGRSAEELLAVVRDNPFLAPDASPVDRDRLHVAFLAERPAPERVETLDPERSPPDEYRVHGDEIYLHCPNGLGRSKLTTSYFDARLETTCTVRNWKTVLALADMVADTHTG